MSYVLHLRANCILAVLRFTALGITRVDARAERPEGGRVVASRLPGADAIHKRIVAAQQQARQILISNSLPYGDESWRLLPVELMNSTLLALTNKTDGPKAIIDQALVELNEKADELLATAAAAGSLALPTKEELLSAYSMKTDFQPVPNPDDFLHLHNKHAAERLKGRMEAKLVKVVEDSVPHLLQRLLGPLEGFVHRTEGAAARDAIIARGEDPGRVGIFKNTAVTAVGDIVKVLPHLNITSNMTIQGIGEELTPFHTLTPQEVREDAVVRNDMRERAQRVAREIRGALQRTLKEAA